MHVFHLTTGNTATVENLPTGPGQIPVKWDTDPSEEDKKQLAFAIQQAVAVQRFKPKFDEMERAVTGD